MKIFDAFMYFNEDLILDIRFNQLNDYVDKFVIVESTYTHSGQPKKLNFNIQNFKKFSDKIIYITVDDKPNNYLKINTDDNIQIKQNKQILNAMNLDNYQREKIADGVKIADGNDLILVSDVDEIPNLKLINLKKVSSKILIFKQFFFHYKFNLYLKGLTHYGTKGCLKKYFKSPQWLRNIKSKKYNFYRLDILFSDKKYNSVEFIENGGWHFSNLLNEEQIVYKLKSYGHHADFPKDLLNRDLFRKLIDERMIMYDHSADKKSDKYSKRIKLSELEFELLPSYVKNNRIKFKEWLV